MHKLILVLLVIHAKELLSKQGIYLMKTTLVRRTVDLFIGLFAIAALIRIFRIVGSILNGNFGTVTWPVQAEAVGTNLELADNAMIRFPDGSLSIAGEPVTHAIDAVATLGALGLFILALFILKDLLTGFAQGEVLTEKNAVRLRKIAWLLFGVCGISIAQTLVIQPMILSAVAVPNGMALHPSISWGIAGASNIWLHYEPPLITFLLGGLALLFSAAIQSGAEYRHDSESLV